MKKLVSIVLVSLVMSFSANAFAATAGSLQAPSQNNVTSLAGSVTAENIPGFRPGDVLLFDLTGLNTKNHLLLISHKVNGSGAAVTLDNTTVQYLDEYTLTADSQEVKYTIRDIEEGIYKIVINDGTTPVSFYYKVGNPKVKILGTLENDKFLGYVTKKDNGNGTYSIAFAAKASLGSVDVSLEDVGVDSFGFSLTSSEAGTKTVQSQLTQEQITAALSGIEADGAFSIIYGVTVYNIPSGINITAEATIIDAQ